jgi:hypothetical protein
MKTSVEINGYVISIEENEGIISVNAVKDDEVVEEFTIETEEAQGEESESEEGEDVRPFGEFGEEEEDFDGEESEEGDFESQDEDEFESQDEDEDEDKAPEGALESFQSFINKKK